MSAALVGCSRCGFATRRPQGALTTGRCPKCGAALLEMDLAELCASVRERRESERLRRRAASSVSLPRQGVGSEPRP